MKMARAADKWVEHWAAEENKYAELKQDADDWNQRQQERGEGPHWNEERLEWEDV